MKKFFAMEEKGEIKKGTAKRWADHTFNIGALPNKVKDKKRSGKELLMEAMSKLNK